MTRQSPLLQFDDGELRHSFDRKQQVELSPEQFGRNKVVEVSPSNRAAKKNPLLCSCITLRAVGAGRHTAAPIAEQGGSVGLSSRGHSGR
jgi:hypothetical protein